MSLQAMQGASTPSAAIHEAPKLLIQCIMQGCQILHIQTCPLMLWPLLGARDVSFTEDSACSHAEAVDGG